MPLMNITLIKKLKRKHDDMIQNMSILFFLEEDSFQKDSIKRKEFCKNFKKIFLKKMQVFFFVL